MFRSDIQNDAMAGALGQQGPAQAAPADPGMAAAPPPALPPELVQMAFEMGLDIRKPEDFAIFLQLLGAGGGGPLGPMAGAAGPPPAPMPQGPQGGGGY
jgi:hypothetical protein